MPRHRLTPPRVACALAAAVTAASVGSFVTAQVSVREVQAAPSAAQPVATAPSTGPASKPSTRPAGPASPMDRAAESGASIYVNDSFAAVDKIREANEKARQGQFDVAINKFQKIIDDYGDKVVGLNADSYVSITDHVRGQLLAMPAVQDGMYDQIFGVDAKRAIEEAVEKRDITNLIRVSDRYFPATAAFNGLSLAAEWYFERAEFAAAARIWQLLLKHPMGVQRRALLVFRAAVAENLARNTEKAKALREYLAAKFPDAKGPVDGQETNLLAAADEMLKLSPMVKTQLAANEWPSFQGGASRSELLNVTSSVDARLWNIALDDEAITGVKKGAAPAPNPNEAARRAYYGSSVEQSGPMLNSYPVMSNGVLFLHTGTRIVALSATAGTPLWAFPPASESVKKDDPNMGYGYPYRAASHDSVTVADDQVFAILPAAPVTSSTRVVRYYGPYGGNTNSRLACLSRQTGKEIWSTPSSSILPDKPGVMLFIGSPIVTPQGVFVMGRKVGDAGFTEIYLIRLDRNTGKSSWECYLCSASNVNAYYGMLSSTGVIPIPTLVDQVVYISTGQGADCAVDANAGRILWLQITPSAKIVRSPSEMYNPQPPAPSWRANPPVVFGDKVVTCETSGAAANVRIYQRDNGSVVKTFTKTDLGLPSIEVLAGIVNSRALVIGGNNVVAIDMNKCMKDDEFKPELPLAGQIGKLQGRPFLASQTLYVPYQKGLVYVDPKDASARFQAWPNMEDSKKSTAAKPGNLLVTAEQVVVINETEIAGYSKWETAYTNRLSEIQKNPKDADPELALAEIAYRTSHWDIAQEHMKVAVQIANAPDNPAPAGFLTRLYQTNLNFAQQLLTNSDTVLRDRSRFFYEQCALTAREPEQQAEWRIAKAELSLAQENATEAATLYSQVLADSAMRNAKITRNDTSSRAAVAAEQLFHALINKNNGAQVYKPYEDQAQALLNKARAGKDPAGLALVVESYPNAQAAIGAATDLANGAREAKNYAGQLQHLHWLYSHVTGDRKASVTAETAVAYFSLPKPHYNAAVSYADRGARQFANYRWKDASGKEMSFASLRQFLRENRPSTASEGRLPKLPPPIKQAAGLPPQDILDAASVTPSTYIVEGMLLAPIETAANLRRADLLFAQHSGALHIYDAANYKELTKPQRRPAPDAPVVEEGGIVLKNNAPAVLLGCINNTAIVVQANSVVGIDLKDLNAAPWVCPLTTTDSVPPSTPGPVPVDRFGNPIMEGYIGVAPQPMVNSDPEMARQAAFNQLGRPLGFSTMRIVNDKLIIVAAGKIRAIDVATGKSAWLDSKGDPREGTLPAGAVPGPIVGNEDYIAVQAELPGSGKVTYHVFDIDTGRFRKQLEISQDRPLWRSVSDDGMLFVVTNKSVIAYDLVNERDSQPIWKRQDIKSTYATATALTSDGLMVLSGDAPSVVCLSPEGGDNRWPAVNAEPINLKMSAMGQRYPFIRTIVEGDLVIYQSTQGVAAYRSAPQPQYEQVAWQAVLRQQPYPQLQTMQLSDPYVAVLASGPVENTQRAVRLLMYKSDGGKLCNEVPLKRSSDDSEGPLVRNWQIVDNGIAMEINSKVFFYRARREAAKQ